jgi:hypothetical protein
MSRGTTLTLYKKYDLKMDDKSFRDVVRKYALQNKSFDYSKKKKSMKEYSSDIPLIMEIDAFRQESVYDPEKKVWIDNRKENNLPNLKDFVLGYVDSRDHNYCNRMMEWSFGSSFDCLVDYFNIGHGGFKNSMVEISPSVGLKMLEALNYLLGGDWSDKTEKTMDNEFVRVFSEGSNGNPYFKYVNRKRNFTDMSFEKNGCRFSVKVPKVKKEDDEYDLDIQEADSSTEWALDTFRAGLYAFLKSDNYKRHEDPYSWMGYDRLFKYVLTYEYWC